MMRPCVPKLKKLRKKMFTRIEAHLCEEMSGERDGEKEITGQQNIIVDT